MKKLELYLPVNKYGICWSQDFFGNNACIEDGKVFTKQNGVCTRGIEFYPSVGLQSHGGLDIWARHQESLYASHSGIVSEMSTDLKLGYGLGITTDEKYEYKGTEVKFKSRYWHLDSFVVVAGDKVKVGQLIGYADSTGYSSSSHLHFELKPLNNEGGNLEPNNGWRGRIDPMPYLILKPASEIPPLMLKVEILQHLVSLWTKLKSII